MILVAGATGTTGTHVVSLLQARGERVRVLTRERSRASHLQGVEIVEGDVRNPEAVRRSVQGTRAVVSLIQGFAGPGDISLESIDRDGNRLLFDAAHEAGAEHGIMVSIAWASPDSPMDLAKMKFAAEEHLKSTGLAWTILRPSCLMETWTSMIGGPLLKNGKATIFGTGKKATNFVSARDLAAFVDLAVADPSLRGQTILVGGPNMTFDEFAEVYARAVGVEAKTSHFPLTAMGLMQHVLRPFNLVLARQIQMGVVVHTRDTSLGSITAREGFPQIPITSLAEVVGMDSPAKPAQ